MLRIALILAVAFLIQFVLSSVQMKHFNNEFVKLRRKGKVAVGRKSGGFFAGAIVMFQIDEDGIIQETKKLEGTTFLARVKDLPGFEGMDIRNVTGKDVSKAHRNLGKAIEDAKLTYCKYMNGEIIEDVASPFKKVSHALIK